MVEETGELRWPPTRHPTRHHVRGTAETRAQWNLDFRSARLPSARLADAQTRPLTRTMW